MSGEKHVVEEGTAWSLKGSPLDLSTDLKMEASLHDAPGNSKDKTWVYSVLAVITDPLLSVVLFKAWNSVAMSINSNKHFNYRSVIQYTSV